MIELDRAAASLAVLAVQGSAGFDHLATAWCVGEGEWICAGKLTEQPEGAMLLTAVSGEMAPPSEWECGDGVIGFRCDVAAEALPTASGAELHKRQQLRAIGYPSVIDHPAFSLARTSLDAERYLPYLCPWVMNGHLSLYTADDGWISGRFYEGMNGSPVCNAEGAVVGMIIDGQPSPDHPPLTRFRRLG